MTTDNAQVDGDRIDINAPGTRHAHRLVDLQGSSIQTNQIVGRVRLTGIGFTEPRRPIRSPGTGTVAVNNVVQGQYVTAGTELATAYDFTQIYVTARVDETGISADAGRWGRVLSRTWVSSQVRSLV